MVHLKLGINVKQFNLFFLVVAGYYATTAGYNPDHLKQLIKTRVCQKCDLTKAMLQGYILPNANVEGTDFTGANLTGTQFQNANFKDAILDDVNFSSSLLHYIDFTGIKARRTKFVNTHLKFSKFIDADLSEANFTSSTPYMTDFNGSIFYNTRFDHADMYKAILRNTSGNIITDDRTNICCTTMSTGRVESLMGYKCGHQETSSCNRADSVFYQDGAQQTVYTGRQP